MEELKINETPVRTAKNFKINNISLKDINIPNNIEKFNSAILTNKNSEIIIDENTSKIALTYGLGDILTNQIIEKSNQKFRISINGKTKKEAQIEFNFDKYNSKLLENIEIIANENTETTIILKYQSEKDIETWHNGIIRLEAKKNSKVNIIIVNFVNIKSNNFLSIENEINQNAKVKYTIVDFGGKNSITNYYSNIVGENADNRLETIYLGTQEQLFDLNYIAELRGKKSNIDIEVQGALKDSAKKHFKGTIDFKRGSKKSRGNENESCILLSDKAKSISLPMLLCSEEDVEGNHSSSAGKIDEKELFYIMSRGFNLKEAMKLMVRARFNKILEKIEQDELKTEILNKMDEKLD